VALTRALALPAVWLSPPALVGATAAFLEDGTRGLWPALVVGASALLAGMLLAEPWARLPPTSRATLGDLVRSRRLAAGPAASLLVVPALGSTLLFLWAQLAAARDLARDFGWPLPAVLGAVLGLTVLASWRARLAWSVAAVAGVGAPIGLGVGLVAIMLATTPAWPRVWADVASRPRMVFSGDGPWTREGWPMRGHGTEVSVPVREAQRLVLLGRGRARVELWEGGGVTREVRADTEVTLRPGDRLVVPQGFPIRFEAGRSIPGAPASGHDWLDPPGARPDWPGLGGLALTLLLGGLGLAPVHAALAARRRRATVVLPSALVLAGCVSLTLWALYGLWLTPEIFVGGVAPAELFELPALVAALDGARVPLAALARGALAAAGGAAILTALLAVPREPGRLAAPVVLAAAVVLTAAVPADPWRILVAAFGFGAAAGAPGAVLACWSERMSPQALAAGAVVGGGAFVALAALGLTPLSRPGDASWGTWLVAWPAVVAAPANFVVAWLLSPPWRPPSGRGTLPPDLAALHDD